MKTVIEVFCDISTNEINKIPLSKMAYNIKMFKKNYGEPRISIIHEDNNNKAELINVVNAIRELAKIPYDKKRNYPIVVYSDSRYAVDTINQFFAYVKKLRGIPTLYNYFVENNSYISEKSNKYSSFRKAKRRLIYCNVDIRSLIFDLMKIMDTNSIKFKWISRVKNAEVDSISKIR